MHLEKYFINLNGVYKVPYYLIFSPTPLFLYFDFLLHFVPFPSFPLEMLSNRNVIGMMILLPLSLFPPQP